MRDCPSDVRAGFRRRTPILAALLLALGPGTLSAQVRDVISKEIAVGRTEATLALELQDDRELSVAFRDGVVRVDGEEVGRFEPGSGLEAAWRELLGTAVALDDGPLARALADWEPPSDLEGDGLAVARRIDRALESALVPAEGAAPAPPDASPGGNRLVRSLLERTERLDDLARAMEGLRVDDVQIRVGEDLVVDREVQLDATLVVVDADVEVRGTVRGDVVVVDGALRVPEGGRITGDVRLADSRLADRSGRIDGSVVEVEAAEASADEGLRERLRDELRRELRDEIREAAREASRSERDDGWSLLGPFRALGRGLAGLLGVLVNTAVVALLGWGVVFFFPENLAVVTDTVRRSPGRSAVVGLAGAFLLLPVWILGALALILTVVGIFALPFWIALFPLAVAVAAGLGFFASAGRIGEHLAGRRYPLLDWVRSSNAYTLVTGGLVVLAIPFLAANVVEMAVILGFLEGLLTFVGWLALLTATCAGFGAVLITRGGRRPDFYRTDPFDDGPDWPDDGPGGPGAAGPRRSGPSAGDGDDWFRTGAAGTTHTGARTAERPDATATEAGSTTPPEDTGGRNPQGENAEGSAGGAEEGGSREES